MSARAESRLHVKKRQVVNPTNQIFVKVPAKLKSNLRKNSTRAHLAFALVCSKVNPSPVNRTFAPGSMRKLVPGFSFLPLILAVPDDT
jgi:hypothetical protein